jgi:hypothetical protein
MTRPARNAIRTCDTPDEAPRSDWNDRFAYAGRDDQRTQHDIWPGEDKVPAGANPFGKFQSASQNRRLRAHCHKVAKAAAAVEAADNRSTIELTSILTETEVNAFVSLALTANLINEPQARGLPRMFVRAYRASLSYQEHDGNAAETMRFRPTTIALAELRDAVTKLNVALVDDIALTDTYARTVLDAVTRALFAR